MNICIFYESLKHYEVHFVINMNSEPNCKNMIMLFRLLPTTFAVKETPIGHQKDILEVLNYRNFSSPKNSLFFFKVFKRQSNTL